MGGTALASQRYLLYLHYLTSTAVQPRFRDLEAQSGHTFKMDQYQSNVTLLWAYTRQPAGATSRTTVGKSLKAKLTNSSKSTLGRAPRGKREGVTPYADQVAHVAQRVLQGPEGMRITEKDVGAPVCAQGYRFAQKDLRAYIKDVYGDRRGRKDLYPDRRKENSTHKEKKPKKRAKKAAVSRAEGRGTGGATGGGTLLPAYVKTEEGAAVWSVY